MSPPQTTQSRARAHLSSQLQWLRARIQIHTRRIARRGDPHSDAAVTPELFHPRPRLTEDERHVLMQADLKREHTENLLREQGWLPLRRLRRRFRLDPVEEMLLLLGLASEFDADFPRIFGMLNGHADRQFPTLSLLMSGLAPELDAREHLGPRQTLLLHRLIYLSDDPWARTVPQRPIIVAPRLIRYVLGDASLDPGLAPFSTLTRASDHTHGMLLPRSDRGRMRRLVAWVGSHRRSPSQMPLLVLRGASGAGRRRWAETLAESLGERSVLTTEMTALALQAGSLEDGLAVALREAHLQRAVIALRGWDDFIRGPASLEPGDDESNNTREDALMGIRSRRASLQLERALDSQRSFVFLLADSTTEDLPRLRRGLETVDISLPDAEMATQLWERALDGREERADDLDPKALARDFILTPGQIESAVQLALERERLARSPRLDRDRVTRAVKDQLRHRLGDTAQHVPPRSVWDDLIVTDDVRAQLREMISRVRNRARVLEEWAFGERFGGALGVSALFEGPPGTGKTMAASIIASELGLDLYQIDLSQTVSKYIGETEKHLASIFDEAERAGVVLLFDEADSLFAKRTTVRSSNDRYANLKVNFLLQRIERFSGVAILTTNFPEGLDTAFSRRLSLRVSFENPELEQRRLLWKNMLGERPVLADDIDCDVLAADFELTGALIRNSVLRAAFMAAARDRKITMNLLRLASRIELKQQGTLVQDVHIHEIDAPRDGYDT